MGLGEGELDKGSHKAQTSSYMIKNTKDIMSNIINIINTAVHYKNESC